MPHQRARSSFDPKNSWPFVAVIAFVALCVVIGAFLPDYADRRRRVRENWPEARGTPVSIRIVEIPPTSRFPITYYAGECLVEYQVAGRSYRIWAFGGLSDREQSYVADRMTVCPIARYVVYHNPKDPQDATASRPENSP